jgi:hypothetical protein
MLWPDEKAAIDAAAGGSDVSTWAREVLLKESNK